MHVTFAVGWFAPEWRDSSSEPRYNRYSQRFRSAEEVANFDMQTTASFFNVSLPGRKRFIALPIRAGFRMR